MADLTDKNVYILGAGFSRALGLPLQDDFLQKAKEIYFTNLQKFKHFKTIFDYQNQLSSMRNYLSLSLLNLENLFNLIEMQIFYRNTKTLCNIKDDFVQLIIDVLVELTPAPLHKGDDDSYRPSGKYELFQRFLSMFCVGKEIYPDSIITFNYDLILENALFIRNRISNSRKGTRADQLEPFVFNVLFDKRNISIRSLDEFYGLPQNEIVYAQDAHGLNEVKLLKLHGSINWDVKNKQFIVPPTWQKSDPQVRRLWQHAYNEIKEAKRIIIIGYSFPESDIYVKSLLGLAISHNQKLQKIIFVNPDKELTKNRSEGLIDEHFKKYCRYLPMTLADLLGERKSQPTKEHFNRSYKWLL